MLLASPALASAAPRSAEVRSAPNRHISHGKSTNWSGYAVTGSGSYTSVSASWTQPEVNCASTPNGWSAFWVGIDGDTTNTVEQTGTEANCSGGTPEYGAWYEMYPKRPFNYAETVSPGDSFTATVTYLDRARFQLTLSDNTAGWSQTVTKKSRKAKLGSAEVIVEAPSEGNEVLPLADFGTATFSGATVDGSLLTSSTPGLEPLTMASGKKVKAEPSSISSAGSFSDTWHHE